MVSRQQPPARDSGQLASRSGNGRPVTYASLFAPSGRRRLWWLTYVCPACGSGHFGRSTTSDASGVRRSACGRLIYVKVARTYRGKGA